MYLVPQDYSYLPHSSLLSTLHRLMEGCHGDPDRGHLTRVVLQSVAQCSCELPPCNWSGFVVPYLRSVLCEDGVEGVDTLVALCVRKSTGFQQCLQYCTQPLILSQFKVSKTCIFDRMQKQVPVCVHYDNWITLWIYWSWLGQYINYVN